MRYSTKSKLIGWAQFLGILAIYVVAVLCLGLYLRPAQSQSSLIVDLGCLDADGDGDIDCDDIRACVEGPPPAPAPAFDVEFTGSLGAQGFNVIKDRQKSWRFFDASVNGAGKDAALYAVGSGCLIERSRFFGGKHGIRCASVDGLTIIDSEIVSDPSNLGKSLKICGAWDRAPASRNIVIDNCQIRGIVAIQPQSKDPLASCEVVENVTLRNCVIKPYGNTAVEVAAKNVRIENCVFDFRETSVSFCRGVRIRVFNTVTPENVVVENCRLILGPNQTGELVEDLTK